MNSFSSGECDAHSAKGSEKVCWFGGLCGLFFIPFRAELLRLLLHLRATFCIAIRMNSNKGARFNYMYYIGKHTPLLYINLIGIRNGMHVFEKACGAPARVCMIVRMNYLI